MNHLCLVYLDRDHWHSCPDRKCAAFAQQLGASSKLLAAEPLHPVETATTVRVRQGKELVTDSPFAETKEQLAGFCRIDARDLEQALAVAAQIPPAQHGSLEVRPIRTLDVGAVSDKAARNQGLPS